MYAVAPRCCYIFAVIATVIIIKGVCVRDFAKILLELCTRVRAHVATPSLRTAHPEPTVSTRRQASGRLRKRRVRDRARR